MARWWQAGLLTLYRARLFNEPGSLSSPAQAKGPLYIEQQELALPRGNDPIKLFELN